MQSNVQYSKKKQRQYKNPKVEEQQEDGRWKEMRTRERQRVREQKRRMWEEI